MNRPDQFQGEFRLNSSLKEHTSWKVGGVADYLACPRDQADLVTLLRATPAELPVLFIGRGSNLLVRDGGVRGLVICLDGTLESISADDSGVVEVGAGIACARLSHFAAQHGLSGAEFLAGIPGTLGGALAMNAGAFGGETWGIVAAVCVVDRKGEIRWRTPADYQLGYRQVEGPAGEWFIAARMKLTVADSAVVREQVKALMSQRSRTQPVKWPTAGSVFRNPPGDHAARLIEACGLKGHCVGDACVSEQHANFIVNRGQARAADIEQLIAAVVARVERDHGIRLQQEVHVVGEAA